jgi:carbon-monoxide dehydrogenase iron sulfur subunit
MRIIATDLKKCVGCHSCELACAVSRSQSKNLVEALQEQNKPATRVRVIAVDSHPIPMQCQHCEDAPCARVCPTKALYRAALDQPVLFNRELCIGCSSCVLVCPFGALRQAPGGIMAKCNLCWDRLELGLQPSCVEACPTKARKLVPADYVADRKLRSMAAVLSRQEFDLPGNAGSRE